MSNLLKRGGTVTIKKGESPHNRRSVKGGGADVESLLTGSGSAEHEEKPAYKESDILLDRFRQSRSSHTRAPSRLTCTS